MQTKLRKCGGCGAARYCGRDCQRSDWRRGGHRELHEGKDAALKMAEEMANQAAVRDIVTRKPVGQLKRAKKKKMNGSTNMDAVHLFQNKKYLFYVVFVVPLAFSASGEHSTFLYFFVLQFGMDAEYFLQHRGAFN